MDFFKRLDVNSLMFLLTMALHASAFNMLKRGKPNKQTPSTSSTADTVKPTAHSFYAAAKNKGPILEVLKRIAGTCRKTSGNMLNVLEIASGTCEHAAFFCSHIPRVLYQPSSLDPSAESNWRAIYTRRPLDTDPAREKPVEPLYDIESSLKGWIMECADSLDSTGSKILNPLQLDVTNFSPDILTHDVKAGEFDLLICINMVHIASISCTEGLFKVGEQVLRGGGCIYLYGPYVVNGFMVESNRAFDKSLRERNSEWGVRSVEDVAIIARSKGFELQETVDMPSNNLSVVFKKM